MATTLNKTSSYCRVLDGLGNAVTSTGGALDVAIPGSLVVTQSTHDNLNVNANLQVADADLAYGQAAKAASLPVTLASDQGDLSVTQSNCNANLQVADVDLAYGQATKALSLPVAIASDQDSLDTALVSVPTVGTQNNAFSNASPSASGTSAIIDCQYVKTVDVFGANTTGSGNLVVQISQDGTTFCDTYYMAYVSDATDFHTSVTVGARYLRLKVDAAMTGLNVTVAGKA
jgi:hypothetical protein